MTTIQPPPDTKLDVPLPHGVAVVDPESGWLDGSGGLDYRIITGKSRTIAGTAEVFTSATQLADGTLERWAGPTQAGPTVSVHSCWDNYLTSDQARELATAIFMAAAEVDGWAGGYSPDGQVCTSTTTYTCTSWCIHDQVCQADHFRGDQACWGPEHITVLGLDEHAPAVGRPYANDQPHLSVFAHRKWHALPTVRLHAYREDSNEHLCVDADFHLTAEEALKLSADLAAVVQMIGGAK